jgi:predicted dehydrogenase
MAEKPVGWAVVGLGGLSWGQIMPQFAACKRSKLVALVSGHRDKAEAAAQRFGVDKKNLYSYENYDSLRDNPDVEAVYIVLPNGMHAEYTIRAFQAGKHVLCEKPMANTVRECEDMIAAGKKAGRKLMIAYRCQYEPHNLEAIRVIRAREIGPVRSVIADHGFNIGDPRQWRLNRKLAGGGSLMDIGIYSLQAARYLTGEEPTEISAQMYSTPGDVRFKEVEESVHFMLRFPSGVLANCTSSYGYAGANRVRVIGTEGQIDLEPATAYSGITLRVARQGERRGPGGGEPKNIPDTPQFGVEMDHFSESIRENKVPRTPGEEGLRDVRLMMAIYDAARTGKTVKV